MKLAMLLTPHANARYFDSVRSLSLAELHLMAPAIPAVNIESMAVAGLDILTLEVEEANLPRALRVLERHASCQAVFALEGELLRPLPLPGEMRLGADLSSILKYKGKTNERFTGLLVNAAVFSGKYSGDFDRPLRLLDPMCGRGTGLFEGLRRGYEVSGIEIDKTDVKEATQFFKKYLEFHKQKHSMKKSSMTFKGKAAAERTAFEVQGEMRLTLIQGDAQLAQAFYPAQSFEAIVVDLPYGIQHHSLSGKSRTLLDQLIGRALKAWHALLCPGGAVALAFNAHTVSLHKMREMLSSAGYEPLTGGVYDSFRHWVEQAVDRDIAVAVKTASQAPFPKELSPAGD